MSEAVLQDHSAPHPRFLFATGIENSYPVITGKDGNDKRRDQMAEGRHYAHWREDFRLVRELGIEYLRYGPPYYKVHLGPDRYDWSFADEAFAELRRVHPPLRVGAGPGPLLRQHGRDAPAPPRADLLSGVTR